MLWHEFLATANELKLGETQGEWRSAVSRAYCAVFHFFLEFIESYDFDFGLPKDADANLLDGLKYSRIKALADLAVPVRDLQLIRSVAEYRSGNTIGLASARRETQHAQQIIDNFQALLTTIPAQDLADAVKQSLISLGRFRTLS